MNLTEHRHSWIIPPEPEAQYPGRKVQIVVANKSDQEERLEVIKFQPQPGGQRMYQTAPEFEVLYGGAAGGGKSWMIMFDALGLQYGTDTRTGIARHEFGMAAIEHPEYRAVVFRRKTTQLQKLIDIGKMMYPYFGAQFVLQRKGEPGASFTFPSGAQIYLCHMEQEIDMENHQGLEYQFVGFDELTQFTLKQYLYLFSRCRGIVMNNGINLPSRIRSTTNPTGIGLVWVRKRFIRNGSWQMVPGKTHFFIPDPTADDPEDNPTGVLVTPSHPRFDDAKSRTFIPGLLRDNKILMETDPGYAANIMQMGRKMEAALLHGDWDAFGGDFFDEFNRKTMVIRPFDIPKSWQLIGAIDPGWSSPCAFQLIARDDEDRVYTLFTYYVKGRDAETHAKNIHKIIKGFPYTGGRMPDFIVAGADAFHKKDLYSIKRTDKSFADIFQENGLYLQKAVTDRVLGWWAMKQYIHNQKYYCFARLNEPLIDEITAAQHDEKNPEDLQGGGNDPEVIDHAIDCNRYGIMALPAPFATGQEDLPDWALKKWGKKKKRHSVMAT